MSTKGKVYMLLSSGDMDGIDKVSSSLRTTLAKSTKDNINTSVLLSSGAMKQNNEAERSVPDDFFTQNPNKSVVALQ